MAGVRRRIIRARPRAWPRPISMRRIIPSPSHKKDSQEVARAGAGQGLFSRWRFSTSASLTVRGVPGGGFALISPLHPIGRGTVLRTYGAARNSDARRRAAAGALAPSRPDASWNAVRLAARAGPRSESRSGTIRLVDSCRRTVDLAHPATLPGHTRQRMDAPRAACQLLYLGTPVLVGAFLWTRGAGSGSSIVYVFTTAVHTGILGALLTLSPRLWYPDYAGTTSAWRLTPLEDQELGGLIMWVPASMIYPGVGLALLAAWLRQSENSLAAARQTEISSRYA
jgi:hypothetical protein